MPAFEAIASTTLSSTQTTITFSSIPATYEHLQLRLYTRSTYAAGTDVVRIRLNSDSGTNYTNHFLGNVDGSITAAGNTGETAHRLIRITGANAGANRFGVAIIDILDYGSPNKNTTVRSLHGNEDSFNGNGSSILTSSVWLNTAAVTAVGLSLESGGSNAFAIGTVAALYGLRSS